MAFFFRAMGVIAGLLLLVPVARAANACGPLKAVNGAALFGQHCVSCHGEKGEGNGPLAASQTKRPADLTTIKKRNNGEFPAQRIAEVIRYGGAIPGHLESGPMPIWAKVFSKECGPDYSRRAVVELKRYLEGMQK